MLGGTFDPPHIGHLALAEAALEALQLDEVLFVPAHRNPAKTDPKQTAARLRLEMVSLAVLGRPRMAVSDIEIRRSGPSYAVDTMRQLNEARPAQYWFLLGADALKELPNWKQPEKLIRLCRLGVAVRPPDTPDEVVSRIGPEYRQAIDVIPMRAVEVSASEIRDFVERGLGIGHWVAPEVQAYIERHKLYRS